MIPPAMTIKGLTAIMTRVSFQPYTNPIIKPAMTVVIFAKNMPIFVPIPSCTLFRSLPK